MRTSCQDIQNEPDFPYSPFETSGAEKKMFFLIKIKREYHCNKRAVWVREL